MLYVICFAIYKKKPVVYCIVVVFNCQFTVNCDAVTLRATALCEIFLRKKSVSFMLMPNVSFPL